MTSDDVIVIGPAAPKKKPRYWPGSRKGVGQGRRRENYYKPHPKRKGYVLCLSCQRRFFSKDRTKYRRCPSCTAILQGSSCAPDRWLQTGC